ncbi:hypothetical protein B0H67DRAFT_657901 [Lasiosphaeris hirsuta]|uniref:Uncharacterized protein n=1 Tax=Lasiosphaeris hirsuta TaxID=260670 RepID=A0AA40E2U9_9PEZI|nr:hypothetical protein B0H67DRAFT_657901 [Lasiosphaeris hirsuta]
MTPAVIGVGLSVEVVGIATENKLSIKETRAKESGVPAGISVDLESIPGTKVETKSSISTTLSIASELEIEEQCDFAYYRLRAFTCHKYRAPMATDKGDMSQGTLFGRRDDGDDDSDESDDGVTCVARFNAFRGYGDFLPDMPGF